MKRLLQLAALFFLAALPVRAQFTLVSGTIIDPTGIPYACGTISATLIDNAGVSPKLNGSDFSGFTAPVKLGCPTDPETSSIAGSFQMQLADNTVITCGISACSPQTQWQFTVNMSPGVPAPQGTGAQSFSQTFTISGSSQTLSFSNVPALMRGVSASASLAWSKVGPVLFGGTADATIIQEPTVFITPVPQVVSNLANGAPVLGMFHTLGYNACSIVYKESLDGVNWFSSAVSIAGHAHHGAQIVAGTIYLTAANTCSGTNGIDIYSGTDAGHMTLLKANIVVSGGGPAWKASSLANSVLFKDLNGSWYLLYEGQGGGKWSIGIATCTPPSGTMTCADYGSNPVIANGSGSVSDPKGLRQINTNSYFTWVHATPTGVSGPLPSDAYFATASSLFGPWTISSNSVLYRTNVVEGVNTAVGQAADFSPVTFNGVCYMYNGAFPNGNNGLNGAIELSIAGIPCEQMNLIPQAVTQPPRAGSFGMRLQNAGQISLTSLASPANVTSLTLTPGTWQVQGSGYFTTGGTSFTLTYSNIALSTSPTSNTFTSAFPETGSFCCPISAATAVPIPSNWSNNTGVYTAVVTTTATYYVNASASFGGTAPTLTVNASITAQRIY
jgi:hypothetical protein